MRLLYLMIILSNIIYSSYLVVQIYKHTHTIIDLFNSIIHIYIDNPLEQLILRYIILDIQDCCVLIKQ